MAAPLAGNALGSVTASFVVAEWKDAGGPPGPPRWIAPLHLHRNDDEAWYVLEGTLCVRVGKDVVEARGFCRFCATGDASYLLESGAGTGPVSAGDDGEYLCFDSGHSRDVRPFSGGAAGGV